MLRMYECNWCWNIKAHDDSKHNLIPDSHRMTFHMRFYCGHPDCKWNREGNPIMHPMIKDKYGDWIQEYRSKRKRIAENIEVVPVIPWL